MKRQISQGKHRYWLAAAAVLILGISLMTSACQTAPARYPSKAVDVIVTFAPGGSSDLTARIAAEFLSKKWGQPINVVNKPGGGGVVGLTEGLRAAPDGYTIMLHSFAHAVVPAIQPDTPYKWDDPTPIALLMTAPQIFTVAADSPWRSLRDVMEAVKKDPGSIKYGLGGPGGPSAMGLSKLLRSAGIDETQVTAVNFDGATPAMAALAGGNVHFAGEGISQALPLIQAGKVRALAVTSKVRSPKLPDVPTGAEAGYPEYDVSTWNGFSGPPRLPESVVKTWADGVKEASQDPEVIKKFEVDSAILEFKDSTEFKKFWEEHYDAARVMVEKRKGS